MGLRDLLLRYHPDGGNVGQYYEPNKIAVPKESIIQEVMNNNGPDPFLGSVMLFSPYCPQCTERLKLWNELKLWNGCSKVNECLIYIFSE